MSIETYPAYEPLRTDETREVETFLQQFFQRVDSYRYNSGVIRLRVIDPRFEGMSREHQIDLVEPYLDQLPPNSQRDIVTLITFAPADLERPPATFREFMRNVEFEHPSPSML